MEHSFRCSLSQATACLQNHVLALLSLSATFAFIVDPAQYLSSQLSVVTIYAYASSWAWPSDMCLCLATGAEYVTPLACMSTAAIPTAFATKDRAFACTLSTALRAGETPSTTPDVEQMYMLIFNSF